MNEYSDWSSPSSESSESGINKLDSLIDILSDSLINGPLTRVTNLQCGHQTLIQRQQHNNVPRTSSNNLNPSSKSYFYVFNHQSESSKFSSRYGPVHGEELQYLFGAPIAKSIATSSMSTPSGFFGSFTMATNYTKSDLIVSQNVIAYFTNFAKSGNPNFNPDTTDHRPKVSADGKSTTGLVNLVGENNNIQFWPEYDLNQRKYLNLNGKSSKIGNNYKSHKMSFWNNLIPKLQIHGMIESDKLRKHLNSLSADQSVDQLLSASFGSSPSSADSSKRLLAKDPKVAVFERISLKFLNQLEKPNANGQLFTNSHGDPITTIKPAIIGTSATVPKDTAGGQKTAIGQQTKGTNSLSSSPSNIKLSTTPINDDGYSTVLSMTIAIGLSLLILNILVFLGVYYKLHNHTVTKRQQLRTNANTRHSTHSLNRGTINRDGTLPRDQMNSIKRRSLNVQAPNSVRNSMIQLPSNDQQQEPVQEQFVVNDGHQHQHVSMPVNYGHQQQQLYDGHNYDGYNGSSSAQQNNLIGHQQQMSGQLMNGQQYGHGQQKHVHYVQGVIPGVCYNGTNNSSNSDTSTTTTINSNPVVGGYGGNTSSMKRCHFADEVSVVDNGQLDSNLIIDHHHRHQLNHYNNYNNQGSQSTGLLGIASHHSIHNNHNHYNNGTTNYASGSDLSEVSNDSDMIGIIIKSANQQQQQLTNCSPSNNPNLTVITESVDEHL